MIDYQGIATLIASVTTSIVSLVALGRQRRNRDATDEKLEVLHKLTNGQSEKLNAVTQQLGIEQGKVIGANQERANPTERVS